MLSTIEPGDYFGEMVLDGGPRSASVMTLEPCRLVVIGHEEVDGLLVANPPFAHDLIRRLIARVRALTTRYATWRSRTFIPDSSVSSRNTRSRLRMGVWCRNA